MIGQETQAQKSNQSDLCPCIDLQIPNDWDWQCCEEHISYDVDACRIFQLKVFDYEKWGGSLLTAVEQTNGRKSVVAEASRVGLARMIPTGANRSAWPNKGTRAWDCEGCQERCK